MQDQWHKLAPGVPKLVIYTAFFWFTYATTWLLTMKHTPQNKAHRNVMQSFELKIPSVSDGAHVVFAAEDVVSPV